MDLELDSSVRVEYLDKNPSGMKIYKDRKLDAELVYTPKDSIRHMPQFYTNRKCIYFLVNKTYRAEKLNQLYVGQSDTIINRLSSHKRDKSFWNLALCGFGNYNLEYEIDLRFLEAETYKEIQKNGCYRLANEQKPDVRNIARGTKKHCDAFLSDLKILLQISNNLIFQKPQEDDLAGDDQLLPEASQSGADSQLLQSANQAILLVCRDARHGGEAYGYYQAGQILVKKGSKANRHNKPSLPQSGIKMRQKLINGGILVDQGNSYIFKKDYLFKTPTEAAQVIQSAPANGKTQWVSVDSGRNIIELYNLPVIKRPRVNKAGR